MAGHLHHTVWFAEGWSWADTASVWEGREGGEFRREEYKVMKQSGEHTGAAAEMIALL